MEQKHRGRESQVLDSRHWSRRRRGDMMDRNMKRRDPLSHKLLPHKLPGSPTLARSTESTRVLQIGPQNPTRSTIAAEISYDMSGSQHAHLKPSVLRPLLHAGLCAWVRPAQHDQQVESSISICRQSLSTVEKIGASVWLLVTLRLSHCKSYLPDQ